MFLRGKKRNQTGRANPEKCFALVSLGIHLPRAQWHLSIIDLHWRWTGSAFGPQAKVFWRSQYFCNDPPPNLKHAQIAAKTCSVIGKNHLKHSCQGMTHGLWPAWVSRTFRLKCVRLVPWRPMGTKQDAFPLSVDFKTKPKPLTLIRITVDPISHFDDDNPEVKQRWLL